MSISDWSMVVFLSSLVYYVSMYYAMFRNPSSAKFVITAFIWAANTFVTLLYGIATNQIGFILLFFLEWIALVAIFSASGKVLKNVDI